ncbi:GTPase [Ligilactobacillus equi]
MKNDAKIAIHTASTAAAGVAASPIPFADAVLLIPIQTTMIVAIYKAYGQEAPKGLRKGIASSTSATISGRQIARKLLKMIPGIGTVAGATLSATVAVGMTEAIGHAVANQLENGNELDINNLLSVISEAIETIGNK